jgi:hypothetical protein
MKVERDFFPAPTGGTEYRWYATVEGKVYGYSHVVDEPGYSRSIPMHALVERIAQLEIAEAIRKDLFGERAL